VEWLSFLALAVQDAQPPVAPPSQALTVEEQLSGGVAMDEDKGGGDDLLPMVALVRAAAAAVAEQAAALSNHPNAALYAAIGRLMPGVDGAAGGHFLELEPCLVCAEQESSSSLTAGGKATTAAAAEAESLAVAGSRSGGAAAAAAAAAGASVPGAGGGRGLVYLNYPLDSIKAASKSTENAMLVQLKGRFKVQRLLVRIADAHGRLVRTIRLHYHSKPVATIADLRMPENAAKWRLAATVH
ncbi:unnamed protein product, partial [Ectocarpus sp. 12 AP-2014]